MFLPPLSFKNSLRVTSFQISLNSLGFYLSRMLVEFFLTCIFQHVWEKCFNLCVHIPRKCIESLHFYSCPSSPLKIPVRIFWKPVSLNAEGMEEAVICSIKIQSEYMKMTWNIILSTFCMIPNYSEYDGFRVL